MPNPAGTKWGSFQTGTAGGVVTWSVASAGEDITAFNVTGTNNSVSGDSFLTHDYVGAISDALAAWSSHGNIEFIQVEDQGGAAGSQVVADIRIFFGAIPGGTIGYAYFPSSFGSALAGDVLLDTVSTMNTNIPLFNGVVLHELGHSLGLDHTNEDSIMQPVINGSSLKADDIAGIQQIYGAQDGAAPVHDMKTNQDDLNILEGLAGLKVNGNNRDNMIDGTAGAETIDGAAGDDMLIGRGGSDGLKGGAGDDTLDGGAGADALNGGVGYDTADYSQAGSKVKIDLVNGGGKSGDAAGDTFTAIEEILGTTFGDTLLGDGAMNWLRGGSGADVLWGRGNKDRLYGEEGNDKLIGGQGRDRLEGNSGADLLRGETGLDNLWGGQGRDTLDGGDHDDKLYGGKGTDDMIGGRGNDFMNGGTQSDDFIFANGHGNDTIADFDALDANEDIDLTSLSAINNANDLFGANGAASQVGADVLIDTGGGNSILLTGVSLAQLGAEDFLF